MAFLEGLLGGGGGDPLDLYGDLFTDKQKAALRSREMTQGLLRMAGALAQAAKPTLLPSGGIGSAIGSAAAAMGGGQDEAMERALKGMQTAEAVRKSKQERDFAVQFMPLVRQLYAKEQELGLPPGTLTKGLVPPAATPATPGAPAAAAPAPAVPPAGGGLGPPPDADLFSGNPRGQIPGPVGEPGFDADLNVGWGSFGGPAKDRYGMPAPPGYELQPGGRGMMRTLPNGPAPGAGADLGGLLAPPPYHQLGAQQQAGILPPPDQVVGQPPPGQGILAQIAAMQQGGAAPGTLPFRLAAAATPTVGGDEVGSGGDAGSPEYLARRARELALAKKYESGGRNIEQQVVGPQGGYNPSVGRVTGPSSAGGYYQMIDSTWQYAARLAGIDTTKYPRAINAPEDVQQKAAEALYDKRGLADWAPYNRPFARAVGWTGPTADGFSGGGAAPSPAAGAGAGGDAPAAPSGLIPGLNTTPRGLALLNTMAKMSGLGEPFSPLLESYYKSPAYLGAAKRATEEVETEFAGPKAAAAAAATQKYIQENETHKSGLELARDLIGKGVYFDKETKTMKPITNAAEAFAAIDAAKPTSDIKEYQFYAQQEKERGGIPKPFAVWDVERRKASATSINTAEGFEAAQTKARVGVDAKIAQDVAEQAITGRRLMPVLDELAYLADKTPDGWRGALAPTVGKSLATLGVTVPQSASNAEVFQALAQRLVPIVREPGATSQGEMATYLASGPALSQTANGRRMMIDINRAMIQRSQEIARVYRENIGSPNLYDKLAALDKPLFTDEQRELMQRAAAGPAASPAPAPAAAAPATPGAVKTPWGTVTPIVPPPPPGTIIPIPPRL